MDWTIEGRLVVEDWMTVNAEAGLQTHQGPFRIDRPLRNVEVRVSGATVGSRFSSWGTTRTGQDGAFRVEKNRSDKPRRIRVEVRFRDDQLQVKKNVGPTLPEWLTVYDSRRKLDGPGVDVGELDFRPGAAGRRAELHGYQSRVRALYWYIMRAVITELTRHDERFGFKKRLTIVFPCTRDVSSAWLGAARVERAADNLVTVIHEAMHIWNYEHNSGTSSWVKAWWDGKATDNLQEIPSVAFHEGFAEYAAWELAWLIWGPDGSEGIGTGPRPQSAKERPRFRRPKPIAKALPFTRRNLSAVRSLGTLARVERNWMGVTSGLRLLTAAPPARILMGTSAAYPAGGSTYAALTGALGPCPDTQLMTFWHVLKTFFPHPSQGYAHSWNVTDDSRGLLAFYERSVGINSGFRQPAHDLMLRMLDPQDTVEAWTQCDELRGIAGSWHPETIESYSPRTSDPKKKKRSITLQGRKNKNRKPNKKTSRKKPRPERRRTRTR